MAEPTNAEVASFLERFGRLLEIAGESGFRVRAYQRAADAVRHLSVAVADVARAGGLRRIEGIGQGLAGLIDEFVRTGASTSLQELERQVPASLLAIAEVPGLGAKSVARLHAELGILDLADLERAAQTGSIRTLPGFSEKTEAKILAGIAALQRRTGRHRLGDLLPIGRRIVEEMRLRLPPGSIVELAGSLRRMEETVADVDVVVGTPNRDAAIGVLSCLPAVAALDEQIDDRFRFRLQSGVWLEAILTSPNRFGSELVRATGNEAHLQVIGDVAEAESEEIVYDRLGLPWIPPELRQGKDEFDLAHAGALQSLVTIDQIKGEFHCHTIWSDGALSVADTVEAATRHGYQFIGISDHTRSLGIANGLDVARLAAQRREIDLANLGSGIRVFASAEVEVSRDGRLDFDDRTLANLDVVIASTHVGLRQPRLELTNRLLSVLQNRNIDIIAHPSGRLLERREGGDFDWDRVFATAAVTGTALEINADPARLDLSAQHARQALAAGCLLTINCDAHHPDGWSLLEYGIANARKAGARQDQVLNCWPLDRIEDWLRERR